MNSVKPQQGEIWLFDPDPAKGTEIGKKVRPGLILSHNLLNSGPSGLVFIVPLTSVHRGIESHVAIDPPMGGLTIRSYALTEQTRAISKIRLVKKLGKISSKPLLKEIRSWLLDFTYIDD